MTSETPRKERDRKLREQDFIIAAEKLFSEKGYHQTSMEDVANAAEYATGTIYRYFPSKEALYHRLLYVRGQNFFKDMKQSADSASSPKDKILAFIEGKVHFFFMHRHFMRIYFNEVCGASGSCGATPPPELQELHDQYMAILREILLEGMKQEFIQSLDVDLVLAALEGLTHEILTRAVQENSPHTEEDITQFIFEFLKNGFMKS